MLNQLRGIKGENVAASVLLKKGYKILQRNWRSGKHEVDIIAKESNTLIFVEVKTRVTKSFGNPLEMVSQAQRNRIIKSANHYVTEHENETLNIRFDLVSVLDTGSELEIEHIEDAYFPIANKLKICGYATS